MKRRNHLIIELLYSSGLRVSELSKLTVQEIDFDQENRRFTIQGLVISKKGRAEIQLDLQYLSTSEAEISFSSPLIPS